jgi:hypothetical protein
MVTIERVIVLRFQHVETTTDDILNKMRHARGTGEEVSIQFTSKHHRTHFYLSSSMTRH